MRLFSVCVILLSCVCGQTMANAQQQKYQIAAAELSGLLNAPIATAPGSVPTGVYALLLSDILQETGLAKQYELLVLPMKRAKTEFIKGLVACYAPGLDSFDSPERALLRKDLLSSSPYNYAMVKIISRPGTALVKSAADIGNKDRVSIVRGVPVSPQMQRILNNAQHFYSVNSETENLKMLMSGRVNYSLVFYPDVLAAYRELGLTEQFPFDKNYSPSTVRDNLICHPAHKKAFMQIEASIARYQQQGRLKELLQQYYLPKEFLQ